jgi:tRNA (cytidine56-2'-O)-methyltransferase
MELLFKTYRCMKMITVLRMSHRLGRDDRISTHCGLVSRALGADAIVYSGDHDGKMVEGVMKVTSQFGGSFAASYNPSWRRVLEEFKRRKFTIVHLTAYGMPLQEKIPAIRGKDVLVVVGSEKVPGEVYHTADYNISVGNQPHSEIAALALFLHEYFEGKELEKEFGNAKVKIIPQERGKKVVEN